MAGANASEEDADEGTDESSVSGIGKLEFFFFVKPTRNNKGKIALHFSRLGYLHTYFPMAIGCKLHIIKNFSYQMMFRFCYC